MNDINPVMAQIIFRNWSVQIRTFELQAIQSENDN